MMVTGSKHKKGSVREHIPTIAGFCIIAINTAVVLGYAFIHDLFTAVPVLLLVAPNTAIIFFLLAVVLISVEAKRPNKWLNQLVFVLLAAVLAVLLLMLSEYLFGWD